MPNPRPASSTRKTPSFDFIFGRYTESDLEIPYFQVSMSFSDASQYLRLVTEMPGAESMNWKIEELFQRDIDWSRVERKIVPYLRQQSHPQFFNSLTIALLPMEGDEVQTFANGTTWNAPILNDEGAFSSGKLAEFGPIKCGYWSTWERVGDDGARIGQISWNTRQVCGIAIDGQHRLAAIKSLAQSSSQVGNESSVPVILIVLHPDLGFTGTQTRQGLVETLRQLFIDLNKHARVVSRARQILLDDRDPASICVRTLVGSQLKDGRDEINDTPPSLPLSLVDWHSEQAKFDSGPYVTTILGLDWIVARTLSIKPFHDMMAFDTIERDISRLETRLEISLDGARTRLAECRRHIRPFSFVDEPVNELAVIAGGFSKKWSASLVYILSSFLPYERVIGLRLDEESLTPEFANWYALRQHADDGGTPATSLLSRFENRIANRENNPIPSVDLIDCLENCNTYKLHNFPLAFTVVFQRALFLAYLQYTKVTSAMLEDLSEEDEELDLDELIDGESGAPDAGNENHQELERAREFTQSLNDFLRLEPDVLTSEFEFPVGENRFDLLWLSSFVQPESRAIDFTQAASKRGADLILLIVIFSAYLRVGISADYDQLITRTESGSGGLDKKLQQCLGRMKRADGSIAARILSSRDLEIDDDLLHEQIDLRSRWIWSVLCRRHAG